MTMPFDTDTFCLSDDYDRATRALMSNVATGLSTKGSPYPIIFPDGEISAAQSSGHLAR
jgi:hypothetical protein